MEISFAGGQERQQDKRRIVSAEQQLIRLELLHSGCEPLPLTVMNETLTNFRQAVADSTDLQEKIRGGADLVALGKENGYEFTQEELAAGWKQLQESDEGLTEFELDVVSGGQQRKAGC